MGYTKLDENITTSSIWSESDQVLRVWVYLMARAGADGCVRDTIPAIARACGYTGEVISAALAVFSAPDPHSRTPDARGRRIEVIRRPEFTIRLLNHGKYRAKGLTGAERTKAWRAKRKRDDSRDETSPGVTGGDAARRPVTQAEAEAEANNGTAAVPLSDSQPTDTVRESAPALETAGTPAEDRPEYAEAVWSEFRRLSGSSRLTMSPLEFGLLKYWMDAGVPLRIVLQGMQDCAGTKAKTLRYYESAVLDEVQRWRRGMVA